MAVGIGKIQLVHTRARRVRLLYKFVFVQSFIALFSFVQRDQPNLCSIMQRVPGTFVPTKQNKSAMAVFISPFCQQCLSQQLCRLKQVLSDFHKSKE